MPSTANFSLPSFDPDLPSRAEPAVLARARAWLREADAVLVGMGAGLSAAGGLNYVDPAFFRAHFPGHAAAGFATCWQTITSQWDISNANAAAYWGYMARHIRVMRHEAPVLQPYTRLFQLLSGREHFIVSSNADGQALRAGFARERLHTPQGDYAALQCALPCRPALFDSKPFIDAMLAPLADNDLAVRAENIPRCPHCGSLLVPNLRKDHTFVETLRLQGEPRFHAFLAAAPERLLILELGVGYNSPGVIRYPFERLALARPETRFIRVNLDDPMLPAALGERALPVEDDIAAFLRAL